MNVISVNAVESAILALLMLLFGEVTKKHTPLLSKYHIPGPVIGGCIAALITTCLYRMGMEFEFELPYKETLMLMFFAGIGLSANIKQLFQGGRLFVVFLGIAVVYIIFQDAIGVAAASFLGLDPKLGLMTGSITLSGGHGTGAAWASMFHDHFGVDNALEIAMACATFGLVIGGIIGAPLGTYLVEKNQLSTPNVHATDVEHKKAHHMPSKGNVLHCIGSVVLLACCVELSQMLHSLVLVLDVHWLNMVPNFVYALFVGALFSTLFSESKPAKIAMVEVARLSSIALSVFLSMALLEIKLWQLFDMALSLVVILTIQTLFTIVFVTSVTYKLLGKNYDAAVMASGHAGFGLGATPTAMLNMNGITGYYGPSPQAYFIVPLIGAFFIDLSNLIVIETFLHFMS
ncbi:sodium/glutamate symporter [Vibrio agarivorans]|uniref:Sodium/glutamate symporter n=1 Tax=Vibrio agarivorans TaxID=153622 RepID=A0ABT7Y519_9VIBR|nr:sodium/glutamate symporter [Vibrio agarivorans]MDN2482839.1 sodium/glutamate symporter [Vibrio agarivorans]